MAPVLGSTGTEFATRLPARAEKLEYEQNGRVRHLFRAWWPYPPSGGRYRQHSVNRSGDRARAARRPRDGAISLSAATTAMPGLARSGLCIATMPTSSAFPRETQSQWGMREYRQARPPPQGPPALLRVGKSCTSSGERPSLIYLPRSWGASPSAVRTKEQFRFRAVPCYR